MPAPTARRGQRRTINEINMVPFIDVMLVLLIIFMVTAPLIQPSLIDLPSIGRANAQPDRVIEVTVQKEGRLALSTRGLKGEQSSARAHVSLADLPKAVNTAQMGDAKTPVVISADKAVQYEQVVKVMDALQKSGVQRVGLSVILANP